MVVRVWNGDVVYHGEPLGKVSNRGVQGLQHFFFLRSSFSQNWFLYSKHPIAFNLAGMKGWSMQRSGIKFRITRGWTKFFKIRVSEIMTNITNIIITIVIIIVTIINLGHA